MASDKREAVGVVGQPHRAPERALQIPVERPADQPGGVCVLHQPGGRRHDAGHADAHRRRSAGPLLERSATRPAIAVERAVVVVRAASPRAARPSSTPSASIATASILVPPRSMPIRISGASNSAFRAFRAFRLSLLQRLALCSVGGLAKEHANPHTPGVDASISCCSLRSCVSSRLALITHQVAQTTVAGRLFVEVSPRGMARPGTGLPAPAGKRSGRCSNE